MAIVGSQEQRVAQRAGAAAAVLCRLLAQPRRTEMMLPSMYTHADRAATLATHSQASLAMDGGLCSASHDAQRRPRAKHPKRRDLYASANGALAQLMGHSTRVRGVRVRGRERERVLADEDYVWTSKSSW